jgi:hypothetical protein
VLAARYMNENSMRRHTSVVARPGRYAHGLAAFRIDWSCGA